MRITPPRGQTKPSALPLLHHDIHQLLRHHDHALHGFAFHEFLRALTGERHLLQRLCGNINRHDDLIAQLAVDLHDDGDLILGDFSLVLRERRLLAQAYPCTVKA